eukprot:8194248-Pyramimonas_sp.AAC.1
MCIRDRPSGRRHSMSLDSVAGGEFIHASKQWLGSLRIALTGSADRPPLPPTFHCAGGPCR